MNTTITALRKEYTKLKKIRDNYASANFIFDLNDADSTYLKLCIQTEEAYRELKKAELSEFKFQRYYAPVISYRIAGLKSRLSKLKIRKNRGIV